ncbi:MAG: hypothetical protein IPM54_44770 [Polyangiaceae bacterium]|nr:hypothetical protein [Polyangiaceae bacterium]
MEPFERLPRHLLGGIAAYKTTGDIISNGAIDCGMAAAEIEQGARDLQKYVKASTIHRLFGAVEHIQVPIAQAREKLDISGMRTATALNFRDKHRMKSLLEKAGVPCARHRTAESVEGIWKAAEELGFPLVVKPPTGAGAASTFRVNDAADLERRLPSVTVGPKGSRPRRRTGHGERAFVRDDFDRRQTHLAFAHALLSNAARSFAQSVDSMECRAPA